MMDASALKGIGDGTGNNSSRNHDEEEANV